MSQIENIFGRPFSFGNGNSHGSNILKKITDTNVRADPVKLDVIQRVAVEYSKWRFCAENVPDPHDDDPSDYVTAQTNLYSAYRDMLDEPAIDVFDSRGALQPSALEEFCTFLFRPLVQSRPGEIVVGHHEVFQGLYFTAQNFDSFSEMPTPLLPVGNLDFVIGKKINASLSSELRSIEVSMYVPAVAIECKTYLDRPRLIESEVLSTTIKRGFPSCLYIVVSEFLKLDLEKVNIQTMPIDQIYIIRRDKNVDRSIRRSGGHGLRAIHVPAVIHLFRRVRDHLSTDWSNPDTWQETGILKG